MGNRVTIQILDRRADQPWVQSVPSSVPDPPSSGGSGGGGDSRGLSSGPSTDEPDEAPDDHCLSTESGGSDQPPGPAGPDKKKRNRESGHEPQLVRDTKDWT